MNCNTINSTQIPGYIVEHDESATFGKPSDQGAWRKSVASIIEGFSLKYAHAVCQGQNLQDLFYQTFKEGCGQRSAIAVAQKTGEAELFGQVRCFVHASIEDFCPSLTFVTPLVDRGGYGEYQKYYQSFIARWVKKQPVDVLGEKRLLSAQPSFKLANYLVEGEDFNPVAGRTSRVEMYVIPYLQGLDGAHYPNAWAFAQAREKMVPICTSLKVAVPANESQLMHLVNKEHKALGVLKEKEPEAYRKWIYRQSVVAILQEFQLSLSFLKTSYLIMRVNRIQMRDQKLTTAVNSLCTLISVDQKRGQISNTLMVHQDQFLVQKTMAEAASVFKEVLEHRGSAEELKSLLALLEFLLANATPVARGNAAITEWIILSLALYKGYRLFYSPKKCMNLEALVKPFPEFMKEYTAGVVLEKIEEPQVAAAASP